MTANRISIENSYCYITFVPTPQQVKRTADLPNWFITLGEKPADPNVKVFMPKSVKVYLQIQQKDHTGPLSVEDTMRTIDYVKVMLDDPKFIGQFGELVLNNWMQKSPNESENYRVGKELYNFFKRRGRDIKSMIEESSEYRHQYTDTRTKKLTPITLAMDSDTVFKTTQSHACFKRNYKCISGTVSLLGQTHHFELSHPLFDLSLIMTAGDARKNIVAGLHKAFPFIDAASIRNWTFDNQVQGK